MSTIDIQYCKNVCRDDHVKHIHSTDTPITISHKVVQNKGVVTEGLSGAVQSKPSILTLSLQLHI